MDSYGPEHYVPPPFNIPRSAPDKRSELHHRDEFLHNYYMFESVHDGDLDCAVRIFIGLSYELWGLII